MSAPRSVSIDFDSEEAFRAEYRANIANGGIFAATESEFVLREAVRVRVGVAGWDAPIELDGEVVHVVPVDMARTGATPGVAVQFLETPVVLRERFASWLCDDDVSDAQREDPGRRKAPRAPARVRADIELEGRTRIQGRTRNLSTSGVLVSSDGDSLPLGSEVSLALSHPLTRERRIVPGRVARHVASETGEVIAFAVEFETPEEERDEFEQFVADVKTSEHSRRLGGINGSVSEIGIENVLQMFSSASRQGTLHLVRGEEEGVIVFQGGRLRLACLGASRGAKALSELLAWKDGRFEFETRVDEDLAATADHEPIQLEAAILDALRQVDERLRDEDGDEDEGEVDDAMLRDLLAESEALPDSADLDPTSVLRWCGGGSEELSEIEDSLRELARVGMPLERAFTIIPEPEETVRGAVVDLLRRGLVVLD